MAAPFAAIELATASAAMAALANSTATLPNGAQVYVLFDSPQSGAFGGMMPDTDPSCSGTTADLSLIEVGDVLTINAAAWTVCLVDPDGTGMTTLRLKERADNAFDNGFSTGFGA